MVATIPRTSALRPKRTKIHETGAAHLKRRTVAPPGALAFNRSRLAMFSPSFLVKIYQQGHTGEGGVRRNSCDGQRRQAPKVQRALQWLAGGWCARAGLYELMSPEAGLF
jgi:hypothetical protein